MSGFANTRHIFGLLLSVGVFTGLAILGSVFWLTDRLDAIEEKHAHDVIRFQYSSRSEYLARMLEDHAYWDHGYDVVVGGDRDEIYSDLGSSVESGVFDEIFFFSGSGELLQSFETELKTIDTKADPAVINDALTALRGTDPADYEVISNFDGTNHRLIAAAWVTPGHVTLERREDHPIMVVTLLMNQTLLHEISMQSHLSDLEIRPGPAPDARVKMDILGLNDQPVAHFAWKTPMSGTTLRASILPALLVFLAAIFTICALAGQKKKKQGQLLLDAHKIARTDQLTGLMNRAGLHSSLDHPQVQRNLARGEIAVIYMDLNNFKSLNDTYGHAEGDIALKVTAERLTRAAGPEDILVRLGGDEFVCFVTGPEAAKRSEVFAHKLMTSAQDPISFSTHAQVIDPAIGIAFGNVGIQWQTLLANADAAMYWAKQRKRKDPVFYTTSMHDDDSTTTSFAAE